MGTQELKYKAVYNWVLENINSGALKVGEKLPSENELSERFGLSRQTVRHAVDILEQQKLVLRVRGSGTYVGGNGKAERPGAVHEHRCNQYLCGQLYFPSCGAGNREGSLQKRLHHPDCLYRQPGQQGTGHIE